jgi:galactitol PTS system EIIA component
MEFDDLIKKDMILIDLDVSTKEEALLIMSKMIVEKGYASEPFINAILDREKHYPSGLPMENHKIAIPHTDVTYVKKSVLLFARLKNFVEFSVMGDPDQKIQVRLISMFALTDKKLIGSILTSLITAYQDDSILEKIINAEDENTIFNVLKKKIRTQK